MYRMITEQKRNRNHFWKYVVWTIEQENSISIVQWMYTQFLCEYVCTKMSTQIKPSGEGIKQLATVWEPYVPLTSDNLAFVAL